MRAPFGMWAAASLLVGCGACLLLPVLPPWPLLALAFAVGFGVWVAGRRGWWLGPLLVGFGLAGLHASVVLQAQLPPAMEGGEAEVAGRVVELPQIEARRTRFRLRVGDDAPVALRGKVLAVSWYDDFGATSPGPRLALRPGEQWRFRLRLRAPRGLRNPGGFDRERYLLSQRVAATGYVRAPDSARRVAPGQGIDAWRGRVSVRIADAVAAPSSRFVRALALGDTGGFVDADWDVLRAAGLTHLIAISGFHVGLAAGFFALLARGLWWLLPWLCLRLPRPQAAGVAAALGGLVYAAVAGFALPTVRTLLMILVVVALRLWRRPHGAGDALAMAAIAMLLVDPLAPLAPGFWLSFMGVAWLIWCLPRVGSNPVREFLGAQLVATVALLPLTVVLFGQASLAGPFANLLAVPWWSLVVVPLALLGTAADALHAGWGDLLWNLSAFAFDLSWPLFEGMAKSPFALWWLPESRWFALPLALLGAFWLLLPRGVPGKPLALLLWLPLLWPDRGLPRPGEAEIVMLDVGQGLSLLVRTANHSLLYDAGPAAAEGWDAGERVVVPALRALGVRRLDAMLLSHADNDHAGGADAVRAALPVRWGLGAPGDPLPATRDCVAGMRWQWDGVVFRVLHPGPHFPYLKNESSCVLRIETVHGAALLTGDIGEVVERMLVQDLSVGPVSKTGKLLHADLVAVAHHGSRGSSDPAFVQATGARLALVSAAHDNRFGHPHPDVVSRWERAGASVLETASGGAIRIRLGSEAPQALARRRGQPRLWDAARRRETAVQRDCGPPAALSDGSGGPAACAVGARRGLSYRAE